MSKKYPGGILSKSAPVPGGAFQDSTASGMWNMDDVAKFKQEGLWPTPGNVKSYIDDVFSTTLYAGNDSSQTITTGIDLAGSGGMVWVKGRDIATEGTIIDTARGINKNLNTTSSGSQHTDPSISAFSSTGFTINSIYSFINDTGYNYVAWTFRKAPKFFDVVTYTGNGATSRSISHNLQSKPGCIIVKCTSSSGTAWQVVNRDSSGVESVRVFNSTIAAVFSPVTGNNSYLNLGDSTTFNVTSNFDSYEPSGGVGVFSCNTNGATYIAYIFAHNAGGFGDSGTDNVISCGSYTGNGSVANAQTEQNGPEINVGYEPQWVMIKSTSSTATGWFIQDSMRGFTTDESQILQANSSSTESAFGPTYKYIKPTSTGFKITAGTGAYYNETGVTYLYITIRRSMKPPTVGTSVFSPKLVTATQSTQNVTGVGFSPDMIINGVRSNANYGQQIADRLRGVTKRLFTNYPDAEGTYNGTALVSLNMDGFTLGSDSAGTGWNAYSGYTSVKWCFKRASRFFDMVAYTGTGVATTVPHNLGVVPEMMWVKRRSGAGDWQIYHAAMGPTKYTLFDGSTELTGTRWNNTAPTSSVFSVDDSYYVNYAAPDRYVAYLFATLAGVSKVGSYTGTGTTLQINCGFTSGARFVLIHRIDSGSNNWFAWDTARGIISGNDPYLQINNALAEVTNTDYIDPVNSGFELSSTAPAELNASGGRYIFLAIA